MEQILDVFGKLFTFFRTKFIEQEEATIEKQKYTKYLTQNNSNNNNGSIIGSSGNSGMTVGNNNNNNNGNNGDKNRDEPQMSMAKKQEITSKAEKLAISGVQAWKSGTLSEELKQLVLSDYYKPDCSSMNDSKVAAAAKIKIMAKDYERNRIINSIEYSELLDYFKSFLILNQKMLMDCSSAEKVFDYFHSKLQTMGIYDKYDSIWTVFCDEMLLLSMTQAHNNNNETTATSTRPIFETPSMETCPQYGPARGRYINVNNGTVANPTYVARGDNPQNIAYWHACANGMNGMNGMNNMNNMNSGANFANVESQQISGQLEQFQHRQHRQHRLNSSQNGMSGMSGIGVNGMNGMNGVNGMNSENNLGNIRQMASYYNDARLQQPPPRRQQPPPRPRSQQAHVGQAQYGYQQPQQPRPQLQQLHQFRHGNGMNSIGGNSMNNGNGINSMNCYQQPAPRPQRPRQALVSQAQYGYQEPQAQWPQQAQYYNINSYSQPVPTLRQPQMNQPMNRPMQQQQPQYNNSEFRFNTPLESELLQQQQQQQSQAQSQAQANGFANQFSL